MIDRHYEDFHIGQEFRSPGKTFTESEILEFAFKYDPQPFHIDLQAAEASQYGGLIASGWHVMAVAFRLFTMTDALGPASEGAPGIDDLRWRLPVRPGDTIRTVATVEAMRLSGSRPGIGLVTIGYRVENQKGETVASMRAVQFMQRRENAHE